jgi:hypothetical protein
MEGKTGNIVIRSLDLKFLSEPGGDMTGTSNPPA